MRLGKYNKTNIRYRNVVLFVGLAIMWGSGFVAIRVGLPYYPPVFYAALRNGLAAVFVFGYAAIVTDRLRPRGWKEWVVTVMSGMLIVGGYQGLLFLGQQTTTSGVAAVITGMVPILTTGFARLIPPQEHLNRRKLVGLVTGLVGIVLVVRPSLTQFGGEGGLGKLFIFLGAGCFALGSVATQRVTISLPVETYQAWALGFGALFIHGMSLLLGESVTAIQWTNEGVLALLYLIVIPSGVGFLFYFKLHDQFGSTETNLVMNVSPIFAALIGWLVLREGLDFLAIIGFATICVGLALISRS